MLIALAGLYLVFDRFTSHLFFRYLYAGFALLLFLGAIVFGRTLFGVGLPGDLLLIWAVSLAGIDILALWYLSRRLWAP